METTINLKNKSLADIQAMIKQLTAVETVIKEQETAKVEALAKYENDKFQWAQTCCKMLKGVTPETFEAIFTELPAKPVKPAILNTTTKVTRTRTNNGGSTGLKPKSHILAETVKEPVSYATIKTALTAVYPDITENVVKQHVVKYCKKTDNGLYMLK